MMEISDRLCREYGLSVIEKPHKAPSRPVWLDEKSGKPTRYNVYRADVQEAMDFSRTPYYMEDYLRRKGYITDFTGKHWKIRLPQAVHSEGQSNHGAESADSGADPRVRGQNRGVCAEIP